MNRFQRVVFGALALSLIGVTTHADGIHPTLFGIRPLGMGNAHVAVANDRNALYYNPAGLTSLKRTGVSGLGLYGGIDNEFLDVVRFVQDNEDRFTDFETIDAEFYESLAPYDDKWVAADGSAYVDVTRPNFGLGVYSTGFVQFKMNRGVYEPRVHGTIYNDIVTVLAGAMPLRSGLRVGGALKGIWRRQTTEVLTARDLEDFSPSTMLDDLESAEPGFGMDLGVHGRQDGSPLAVGAVLRDAPGIVGGESIGSAFDLGAAWNVIDREGGLLRGVVVAADVRDGFADDAFGKKLHFGAEARIPGLALRTGLNQGYPTFGASVMVPVLSLNYAFYGRELGEFPGAESQFLHAVEARIGF
jgi:hypothetical protein